MISRRKFLSQSLGSLAGLFFGPSLPGAARAQAAEGRASARELFLIGDGVRGTESLLGVGPYSSRPGRIRRWQPGQRDIREIALPFLPHSFVSRPDAPHRVITFEKWGRHLAEVDIQSMTVIRITRAAPGRRFFGHGVHGGKYFYATQMDDVSGRGLVAKFGAERHDLIAEFETQGMFPHDCQWMPDSRTLTIVNSRKTHAYGQPEPANHSSMVWLDTETGKCSQQIWIEKPEFGYAHFARSRDGFIVLGGSYDTPDGRSQPLLAVIRPDGQVQALNVHASRLRGEVLSLHLNEASGQVVATFPLSSRIQVWNYQTGELLRQAGLDKPRGLAFSAGLNRLLVSSAQSHQLFALDEDLAAHDTTPSSQGLAGSGSHLFRLLL